LNIVEIFHTVCYCACMSLVAGLLWPRLFSSKLNKLKAAEKYSGSATYSLSFLILYVGFVLSLHLQLSQLGGYSVLNMLEKTLHF
jgi:hypothetical protein